TFKIDKKSKFNSLAYHNGWRFSTRDNDNDESGSSCAQAHTGAWWYKNCAWSNLNGRYFKTATSTAKGNTWFHWINSYATLKFAEMKTRRNN
uniref:Fibrinogen C-terminal domain-containing protein n=1 Tax=Amphimedon queenslandica TaxID=400682 RepID=A0A1X7U6H0_AMPQE